MKIFEWSNIKLYENAQVASIQFVGKFNDKIARKAILEQFPRAILGNKLEEIPFEVNNNMTISGYALYEIYEAGK